MKYLFMLIGSMILGFLGLKYIESGFLAGLSALMIILPPFIFAGLVGTALVNRQVRKHIRGK